jgi:hypothetical protein
VDASTEFNDTYHEFMRTTILPLFPEEKTLVIQKTPNIRFSFPNSAAIGKWQKDTDTDLITQRIGFHCDADFGHHFLEMNFIVPITHMYESNSVYYQTEETVFENLCMLDPSHQFFQGYFNKIPHYNMVNRTGDTRISFDLRVIPYSQYMEYRDTFIGTKFDLEKYYIVL